MSSSLWQKIKQNRPYLIWFFYGLLLLLTSCLFYLFVGHRVIEQAYYGKSISIFNKVIQGQKVHPLNFYISLADRYFLYVLGIFLILSIFSIVFYVFWTRIERKEIRSQTIIKHLPIFVAVVVYIIILLIYSQKFGGNITGFLCIGDRYKVPHLLSKNTFVLKNSFGYDGQFYYYIARDPLILTDVHEYISLPAYRYQRVLYPLIASGFSLGRPALIPYAMLLVNIFGVMGGTYLIIKILDIHKISTWYSICYALYTGLLLSTLRSLTEPMAFFFMLLGLYGYMKDKGGITGVSLSLAALARETTLLVPFGLIFYELVRKRSKKVFALATPFFAYFLWQAYILFRLGNISYQGGLRNYGTPFVGLFQKFTAAMAEGTFSYKMFQIGFLTLTVILIILSIIKLLSNFGPFVFTFFLHAVMIIFFTTYIWAEPWAYTRAVSGLFVFWLLSYIEKQDRVSSLLLWSSPILFFLSIFWLI